MAAPPSADSPMSRPRVKRSRLPPDPSSTLLQGLYLKVPSRGSTPKLVPGATQNPLFGPLGMTHDVSYRLDATAPVRLNHDNSRPATVSDTVAASYRLMPGQLLQCH